MRGTAIIIGLAVLSLAAPAQAQTQRCKIGTVGEFEVEMTGLRPMVSAKVNGHETKLLVDSGAFFSMLEPSAMADFGLKKGTLPPGFYVRGVGGRADPVTVGVAETFEVGGLSLKKVDFIVGGASFNTSGTGLLGQNVLNALDTEYDLANGVVRMFRPEGCEKAMLAYWAAGKPVGVLDIESRDPLQPHIIGTALINGRKTKVLLDTGASLSMLKQSAAAKVGFDRDNPKVVASGIVQGIGRGQAESWVAPFASFEIGGEKILNTRLRVADFELGGAEMLLGADFFLSHRIYVAGKQNKLYFTYNGGPVFKLDGANGVKAAEASADLPDAAAYSRRAAATYARRDYATAITDFSRAIDLEPDQPQHYYQRALAHQGARQPGLALADLDRVLALKSDHVQALLLRGRHHLRQKDVSKAKVDFDAANRAAAGREDVRMNIGGAYFEAGMVDEALAEYDAWLTANPAHADLWAALNARCWARALANRELDKALEDCNAAIKARTKNAAMLDSRGLVYLRMNQLDKAIADYDEALRRQPKYAWPMYGRGLAKVRKGQLEEGRAEMAAALALSEDLAAEVQRYGLLE